MWHIDAEIISFIFMLVIIYDGVKTNVVKALKDKMFNTLAITTLFAIGIDIISSIAMNNPAASPLWILDSSLALYFISTPLLSAMWLIYTISIVTKDKTKQKIGIVISLIPIVIYTIFVLLNDVTHWMFTFAVDTHEYARGCLFNILYVIFYGYSIATLLIAFINFKKNERTTSIVLSTFPIIVGAGVYLQQQFFGYLVMGAAFTLVLLITYLFLQNRKVTRDSLTGVSNRFAFLTAISRLLNGKGEGYVLTIAIDDFKMFNQTFGQKNGDKLLCKMAEYLVSASPSKMAYRYGGDIFAIILKKMSQQQAMDLAKSIISKLAQPIYIDDIGYSISACVGVVGYPNNTNNDNDSVVTAMDFAIYQAKKSGKGQVAFFNEELVQQLKRKHDITNLINSALKTNAFEVYIQPIYNTKLQRFTVGEALLRLKDKKLGVISPREFIPIAEETGQIVDITYFVLEEVCKFIKSNRDLYHIETAISVNFSVVQFMQGDMAQRVKAIIKKFDIPTSLIKIEITESVIADTVEGIKGAMNELNDIGISFALDDYGCGYSNISYLINLPFTHVKLDKSIVDNMQIDVSYVSALIPMFKSLNKRIIAEGVETKEQADILCQLNCDAIQGYYYARPMTMDKATELYIKASNGG